MLAKETDEVFDDKDWLYEIKWDGYRAIADLTKEDIELYSRNGNSFLEAYPVVVSALNKIKHKAVLDGEIVVLNEKGFPDFQKIQHYEDNTNFPIQYYVFDLLSLNGHSLEKQPLIERKKLLKQLIGKNATIKFSDHVIENGKEFFKIAIKKNLEGVMAKKTNSHYYPGQRTSEWLKIKNHKSADVLIAGYTKPTGSRKYFGSLVLGVKDGNVLKHVGHAGTGYNDKMLKAIYELLQPLIQSLSPFKEKVEVNAEVTWVKPVIVCEVKFTQWTKDGKLRHPVFLRLRNDKSIKEIDMKNSTTVGRPNQRTKGKNQKEKESDADIKVGRTTVKITNRSKLYWPDEGITKGMLIDYYQAITKYILPFLKDRPQSLKRNPNGIKDTGFFHKDAGEEAPSFVKTFKVHSESTNKKIDYIICNDKATLAYLNNLGCIELNPWHSTIKKPDNPDYLIIDIDPSDKNTFDQVVETAIAFKKVLDKAGAKSFCKTSGASGMHIYVPMGKKYDYEEVKNFAQLLCMIVCEELPDITTMERNLKKRGNKKIYLDHLQNRRSQTISSVYSVRPKEGATVSMPLQWKEVKKGLLPTDFTIHNAIKRIKKNPTIFKGVLGPATNIHSCLKKLQNSYGEYIPR
ncbi:MAG: DNA ligase D [Ferruginibacter sp.]